MDPTAVDDESKRWIALSLSTFAVGVAADVAVDAAVADNQWIQR